jgi:hypothetical protein
MIPWLLWLAVTGYVGFEFYKYGVFRAGLPALAVLAWGALLGIGGIAMGLWIKRRAARRAKERKAAREELAREIREALARERSAEQAQRGS